MKISIITTITHPDKRQDPWKEALLNYINLADEVIVVNGGELSIDFTNAMGKADVITEIPLRWNKNWSWNELPLHLNAGLAAASGDWIIKLDIDQLITKQDFELLRLSLVDCITPIAAMHKRTILPFSKFSEKGDMQNIINAKFKENVKFGKDPDKYTDLCQPVWVDGYVDSVPEGRSVTEVTRTGVSVWNFDYTFKTKTVARRLFHEMSKAHKKYFGFTRFGNTPQESFDIFIKNMRGRTKKALHTIKNVDILPEEIREKYSELTSSQFGHSGWGLL